MLVAVAYHFISKMDNMQHIICFDTKTVDRIIKSGMNAPIISLFSINSICLTKKLKDQRQTTTNNVCIHVLMIMSDTRSRKENFLRYQYRWSQPKTIIQSANQHVCSQRLYHQFIPTYFVSIFIFNLPCPVERNVENKRPRPNTDDDITDVQYKKKSHSIYGFMAL